MKRIELYKDRNDKYQWRVIADNGEVVAHSPIGQDTLEEAKISARRILDELFSPGIISEPIPSLIGYWSNLEKASSSAPQQDQWDKVKDAYFRHLRWRFAYPERIYNQQIKSSNVSIILLVLLIISGLAFAGFQLVKAVQYGELTSLDSDITVEAAGRLSIGSSVVGAIVLIVSLVFFYLYLKYVHEIQTPIPPHVSLADTDFNLLIHPSIESEDENFTKAINP